MTVPCESKARRSASAPTPGWLAFALFRWSYDACVIIFVAVNGILRLNKPVTRENGEDGDAVEDAATDVAAAAAAPAAAAPAAAAAPDGPNQRVGGMDLDHNGLTLKSKLVLEATGMLYHLHIMYNIGIFSMSVTNVLCFFKARVSWVVMSRAVIAQIEHVKAAAALARRLEKHLHSVSDEQFKMHDGPCPICWESLEQADAKKLDCSTYPIVFFFLAKPRSRCRFRSLLARAWTARLVPNIVLS